MTLLLGFRETESEKGMVFDRNIFCLLQWMWVPFPSAITSLIYSHMLPVNNGGLKTEKKRGGNVPPPHFQGKSTEDLFCELVEVDIQREHVDPRFAEQAKLAARDVLLDELAHLVLAETAGLRDARGLIKRGVGRDVWVQPRTRGGD